jgi:hypothetical protein
VNKPNDFKVDPKVAFTKTVFLPSTGTLDAALDLTAAVIEAARDANRRPLMVEVTVRVAP